MAKFLAELLGCTLPDKGTPVLFECRNQALRLRPSSKQRPTIFLSLTNESAPYDSRLKPMKAFLRGPSPMLSGPMTMKQENLAGENLEV